MILLSAQNCVRMWVLHAFSSETNHWMDHSARSKKSEDPSSGQCKYLNYVVVQKWKCSPDWEHFTCCWKLRGSPKSAGFIYWRPINKLHGLVSNICWNNSVWTDNNKATTARATENQRLSAKSSRLLLLTVRITDCDYSVDTSHTVTLHWAENSCLLHLKTRWGRCFPLEQLETPEVPC